MSYPVSGTYKIINIKAANNTVLDLQDGSATDGTPILGTANSDAIKTPTELLWTLQHVGAPASGDGRLVRLINVQSGTYAHPDPKVPAGNNQGIVGGTTTVEWLLCMTAVLGQYSIETQDRQYAWTFNTADKTQVTLQSIDQFGVYPTQAWYFCPA
ncbi:hypothetical protein DFH29DRAFT_544121 [Suillus ampliporus]|nr:hypothetical protein DFH29DRAFT_544121 [Suillus ampliporus]